MMQLCAKVDLTDVVFPTNSSGQENLQRSRYSQANEDITYPSPRLRMRSCQTSQDKSPSQEPRDHGGDAATVSAIRTEPVHRIARLKSCDHVVGWLQSSNPERLGGKDIPLCRETTGISGKSLPFLHALVVAPMGLHRRIVEGVVGGLALTFIHKSIRR